MRTAAAFVLLACGGLLILIGSLQEAARIWDSLYLGYALILGGLCIGWAGSLLID